MREVANPVLRQVLHRRRILRQIRLSIAAWVTFGGLHIVVWWAAFEQYRFSVPEALGSVVWPLLLAATISFAAVVVNVGRWFLTPEPPNSYDWLESQPATSPSSPAVRPLGEPQSEVAASRS